MLHHTIHGQRLEFNRLSLSKDKKWTDYNVLIPSCEKWTGLWKIRRYFTRTYVHSQHGNPRHVGLHAQAVQYFPDMPDLPIMYCTDVQYIQHTKNSLDLLCLFACVGMNKEALEAVQKQIKRKAMDSLDKNVVGPWEKESKLLSWLPSEIGFSCEQGWCPNSYTFYPVIAACKRRKYRTMYGTRTKI